MQSLQSPKATWQLKAFPFFTALGWVLILFALVVGAAVLATTASSYWGANAKSVRDAAEAGSFLLGQIQLLSFIPRWLEPLVFLGAASFIFGIALEFSTIPDILKNRGQVMKTVFPVIARSHSASN